MPDQHNLSSASKSVKWLLLLLGGLCLLSMSYVVLVVIHLSTTRTIPQTMPNQFALSSGSYFYIFEGQVYVLIIGDGYVVMPNVDVKTLQHLPNETESLQIVYDRQHVYCGSQVLPDLNPKKIVKIAKNYFTDGQSTYYCDRASSSIPDGGLKQRFQRILSFAGMAETLPNYWHVFFKLTPSATAYYMVNDNIITNEKVTYYRNQRILTSAPAQLRYIPEWNKDADVTIPSKAYLADGQQVFFNTRALAIQDHKNFQSFHIGTNQFYLYLEDTGQMLFNDVLLNPKHQPYQFLTWYKRHNHEPILSSPDGLFLFDRDKQQVMKIGENPFLKQKHDISPDIYHDGQHTYFLSYKRSSTAVKGGGTQTCYLRTRLIQLPHHAVSGWKKVDDVYDRGVVVGTIQAYAGQYYYFDATGITDDAMYLIKDIETVNRLSDQTKFEKAMTRIIKDKKLTQVKGAIVAEYKQRKHYCFSDLWDFS